MAKYPEKSFLREFQDAYDLSNGEWMEERKEFDFPGVTGQMLRWFQRNLDDELYRMWCPGPHKSFKRLEFDDVHGEVVEEACAPYGPCKLILRHQALEDTVFGDNLMVPLNRASYAECIDLNGRVLFKLLHEFYLYEDRTVMKMRYHLPKQLAELPLKAFLDHQDEEYIGTWADFLPEVYAAKTWMVNEECVLD